MSCECYRIGGPWVAEDPNCPSHGVEAQERSRKMDRLRSKVNTVSTVEEARELIHEILDLID